MFLLQDESDNYYAECGAINYETVSIVHFECIKIVGMQFLFCSALSAQSGFGIRRGAVSPSLELIALMP
jgi:hypothetical protein